MAGNPTYTNKRFIAGAVCPQCKTEDSIFTFDKVDDPVRDKWRACAYCDFEEAFSQTPQSVEEIKTRVNQHRVGEQPLAHEVTVDAVKIIDQ